MLKLVAIAAFAMLVIAACDSAETEPTTSTASSSTTTTIENDTCERVAEDTVEFLNSLIRELDDTRVAELREREDWPDELRDLDRTGNDLDIRVTALGCDPVAIQQQALSDADLVPGGPLSEGLIELLLTPPTTTTTTTSSSTTTTLPVDAETDGTTTPATESTTTSP